MKNLMQNVLLTCKFCNSEEVTLLDYSTHITNCENNHKIITCPFCNECSVRKGEVKQKDITDLSIFPKILIRLDLSIPKADFKVSIFCMI